MLVLTTLSLFWKIFIKISYFVSLYICQSVCEAQCQSVCEAQCQSICEAQCQSFPRFSACSFPQSLHGWLTIHINVVVPVITQSRLQTHHITSASYFTWHGAGGHYNYREQGAIQTFFGGFMIISFMNEHERFLFKIIQMFSNDFYWVNYFYLRCHSKPVESHWDGHFRVQKKSPWSPESVRTWKTCNVVHNEQKLKSEVDQSQSWNLGI